MASLSFEKCAKFLLEKMIISAVETQGLFSETCTNGELIDLKNNSFVICYQKSSFQRIGCALQIPHFVTVS